MKTHKLTIQLKMITRGGRVNLTFGNKVNVFSSVKYSVTGNILKIAGFSVTLTGEIKQNRDGETVFPITTDDAARLMNKLTRQIHNTKLNLAEWELSDKFDAGISFAAADFE